MLLTNVAMTRLAQNHIELTHLMSQFINVWPCQLAKSASMDLNPRPNPLLHHTSTKK